MKIRVFIPGRLSSQRLPRKLILPLGKTNLWEIALDKLNRLPDKYSPTALCYDDKLFDYKDRFPNVEFIRRDIETTQIEGPNSEIFRNLKDKDDTHFMFLNPCLPFLKLETILEKLVEFETCGFDSATSVKPFNNWVYHRGVMVSDVCKDSWSTKTINDWFEAAHTFHIFSKELLFEQNKMLDDPHKLLTISKMETIDVDTPEDYEFVKWKWEKALLDEEREQEHYNYKNHYKVKNYDGVPEGVYGNGNSARLFYPQLKEMNIKSLIDVGCGTGGFCRWSKVHGIETHGMDWASSPEGFDFFKAPAHDIPLPSKSKEYVTSFDMLEHLVPSEIDIVLDEFERVAIKGFVLTICYDKPGPLHPSTYPESWWIKKLSRYGNVEKVLNVTMSDNRQKQLLKVIL